MLYFTADLHMGHDNIIAHCDRPFRDTADMNHGIADKWNSMIQPSDVVVILGDLAWRAYTAEIIAELSGYKILVRGNHDKSYSHTFWRRCGIAKVHDRLDWTIGGVPVVLTHAPVFDRGAVNLHGHIHDAWRVLHTSRCLNINVGIDVWGYAPVNVNEIGYILRSIR